MKAISAFSPGFPRYLKLSFCVNTKSRLRKVAQLVGALVLACSLLPMAGRANAADDVGAYLQKYAGNWTTSIVWTDGTSDQPMRWQGKSSSELVGTNWVASQHVSEFLGIGYEASESMGYDAEKRAWTSIWVSRMQNYVRVMNGSLTADGRLKLAGKIQDEKSKGWLDALREDCWVNANRYVSQFIKKSASGKIVEKLTVTHDRATGKTAPAEDTSAAGNCPSA